MGRYYRTDPDDLGAPIQLDEYLGMKPGDQVVSVAQPGLPPLPGPLVIAELYAFTDFGDDCDYVTAILNDGQYETSAATLRPAPNPEDK